MKNNRQVKVRLDHIHAAKAFLLEESFFAGELLQARASIKELLQTAKNRGEGNEYSAMNASGDNHFHQHNTLSVLGPRGAGKTSFILTLHDFIFNDRDYEYQDLKSKIIWLPNLDPSRIEGNETFLVTVVANILKQIRGYYKGDLPQEISDKLQSLSREFAVLAPPQVYENQWKDLVGDPDSFAYEVLNKAHSGLNLARSFHEFLRVSLKSLPSSKAEVFIQPIDDIDTAIEQGMPILETLRRYLASPYLITILSGDMGLYETVMTKQHLDLLKDLFSSEFTSPEKKEQIKEQIGQLTEQYLAKVMPPNLRIRLTPFVERIMEMATKNNDDAVELISVSSGEEAKLNLRKIYAKFSTHVFGYPAPLLDQSDPKKSNINSLHPSQSKSARLLPRISRNLVQLFKLMKTWSDETPNNIEKIDETLEIIANIFDAPLYSGNITPNDLTLLKNGRHLEWLASYSFPF